MYNHSHAVLNKLEIIGVMNEKFSDYVTLFAVFPLNPQ
jgi:hypothetical protein